MAEDNQRELKKIEAYNLRLQGYTFAEIGHKLDCHKTTAWGWVKEAQQDALAEAENRRDVLLAEAIDALNSQIKLAYTDYVKADDVVSDEGRLYRDGVKMRSLIRQEVLKYIQEKSKLLGLYAPQVIEQSIKQESKATEAIDYDSLSLPQLQELFADLMREQ